MDFIRYEQDERVANITLDRADKANAQNEQVLDELHEAFLTAERDDTVRVIVLRAEGKHFSAGHDMGGGGMIEARCRDTRWANGIRNRRWRYRPASVARERCARARSS